MGEPVRSLREVVEDDHVDGRRREVGLHPFGDSRRRALAAAAAHTPGEEVVDPPVRDELLELSSVGDGSLPLKPPIGITGARSPTGSPLRCWNRSPQHPV